MLPGGYAVGWLAAGTYDRSVGLSWFTLQITHKIADGWRQMFPELIDPKGPDAVVMAEELARAIGRLPGRTVVYGIEGGSFAVGAPLTPAVAAAAVTVADAIRAEVTTGARPRTGPGPTGFALPTPPVRER